MIKVTFITLGKLKEKYLRDATDEYAKRLSRYCKLDIIELTPINLPEKPSQSEIYTALLNLLVHFHLITLNQELYPNKLVT